MKRPADYTKAQYERYRESGLVPLRTWVPAAKHAELMLLCKAHREHHLAEQVITKQEIKSE